MRPSAPSNENIVEHAMIDKRILALIAIWGLFLGGSTMHAQRRDLGIAGQEAPAWGVTEWLNLPEGRERLDVGDFENKVIYLYGFQAWCPGCHRHGFPALKKIIGRYGDDPGVAIVAVQTTFEGFASNGLDDARRVADRYELSIPIGQSGTRDEPSQLMARYRTGGTPWTIVIDREGVVRFNDFHIKPEAAFELIDRLKKEGWPKEM